MDFWNMTIAEVARHIESKQRLQKLEAQERASYDYILADLIGRSVARVYNSTNKMPVISEAYPALFDSEEIKQKQQEQKDKLSELRFKLFAQSFNDRFKGDSKKK